MAKQTFTTGQVLTAAQMTSLQQTAMGGGSTTDKTTSYVLVAADAGTTVIMNAAGATTITVNTSLFAAGDTVNIQNIGAGICTITAGTATVNTAGSLALNQYEGGVLYFRSTSASTFFDYVQTGSVSPLTTKGDLYGFSTLDARVPIGTNNQVLTADSAQALGLKWATPSSPAFVGCSLTNSGNTSIANASVTTINWDTEVFDTDGFHSLVTNTSRITIPAGKAGKYLFVLSSYCAANATGARSLYTALNGTNGQFTQTGYITSASSGLSLDKSVVVNLAVADYFEYRFYQSSGGALDLYGSQSFFTAIYLGA